MPGHSALSTLDWVIIALYMLLTMALGLYFTRRAGKNTDSFFVSGRSLPWYLTGISMVATSFAADTPLWITSLIRERGVYYVWQYWAPAIGSALAIVLFARLWQRMGVLTDIEFLERRYSGRSAAVLRFWSGFSGAMFICPLTIGWVTKAMEIIFREAMGLSDEYRVWTTILVVVVALISCALSGLWGVIYTDFIQFFLALFGTIVLAGFAVYQVGGLDVMVSRLSSVTDWPGHDLTIRPSIGPGIGQMSIWNAIGFFGLLSVMVALAGAYQAQRILACRNGRHASFALLLHTILYYAFIAWPWIVVALCSLILMPDLGPGVTHDHAYPRMILQLLPMGLRGILIVALLAAYMSTISTLFNWGSSYLVNDVYQRFLVRSAAPRHYVNIGRIATLLMAVIGGWISFKAHDILQLLTIFYVLGAGLVVVGLLRWYWWRLNAVGELAGTITGWVLAPLILFGHILDEPVRRIFGTSEAFSTDPNLTGARMVLMVFVVTLVAVVVSLRTKLTDEDTLRRFMLRARPFHLFWRPAMNRLGADYPEGETFSGTLVSWFLALTSVYSLLFGVGKLLLGSPGVGLICLAVFAVTLAVIHRRIGQDLPDTSASGREEDLPAPAGSFRAAEPGNAE
jgi:SSS family solute:Na+ symporter